MYRDEHAALLARVEALEADLNAEQASIKALEAKLTAEKAHRAEAEREAAELRPKPPRPRGRRGSMTVVSAVIMGCVGMTAAAFFFASADEPTPSSIGATASSPPPALPEAPLPDRLERSQIQAAMRDLKGRVQACYDRFRVPGMAMVRVGITMSGQVSTATILGLFANTPTGACVSAVVKKASFPPSRTSMTITYPFSLQ
ncbi:MAG: hypothetical protein JRH20_28390 [Deltaproteobacteria bacterium]|nr:hypothetical protein [Deltaproteobacteria bacterium]